MGEDELGSLGGREVCALAFKFDAERDLGHAPHFSRIPSLTAASTAPDSSVLRTTKNFLRVSR